MAVAGTKAEFLIYGGVTADAVTPPSNTTAVPEIPARDLQPIP